MSYKSWIDEFMPVPSYEAIDSNIEALQHSKRKWLGLRPEAIQRHKGKLDHERIEFEGESLHIDGRSCALCCKHISNKGTCLPCPLYKVRNAACDEAGSNALSPFFSFVQYKDPEPMIDLIDRAIVKEASK